MALSAALAALDSIPELLLSLEEKFDSPILPQAFRQQRKLKWSQKVSEWESKARLSIETQCSALEDKEDGTFTEPREFQLLMGLEIFIDDLYYSNRKDFMKAIEQGNDIFVELFLICKIDTPFYCNSYFLFKAVSFNHPKIVSLLLKDGAFDPIALGVLPLKEASNYDYLEVFEMLINDPRVKARFISDLSFRHGIQNKVRYSRIYECVLRHLPEE